MRDGEAEDEFDEEMVGILAAIEAITAPYFALGEDAFARTMVAAMLEHQERYIQLRSVGWDEVEALDIMSAMALHRRESGQDVWEAVCDRACGAPGASLARVLGARVDRLLNRGPR